MRSDRGHRTKFRNTPIDDHTGSKHPHNSCRCFNVDIAVLRMADQVLHRAHSAIGNSGFSQSFDNLIAGEVAENFADFQVEFAPMDYAQGVGAVARVFCNRPITEHARAETSPFSFVLDGEQDFTTVATRIDAVGSDRRMAQPLAL